MGASSRDHPKDDGAVWIDKGQVGKVECKFRILVMECPVMVGANHDYVMVRRKVGVLAVLQLPVLRTSHHLCQSLQMMDFDITATPGHSDHWALGFMRVTELTAVVVLFFQ